MLKKKEALKIQLEKNIDLFRCPICFSNCFLKNYSLLCTNNGHTFDLSNKGNVALCKTSKIKSNAIYDFNLFHNRRKFIEYGFYNNLHKTIKDIILNENKNKVILDMGSGEGTHDIFIGKNIDYDTIIGIDLSKDAAILGGDFSNNKYIPIIGDLNNVPIKDKSIDIILNILSPSNENEMDRILKKTWLGIKFLN